MGVERLAEVGLDFAVIGEALRLPEFDVAAARERMQPETRQLQPAAGPTARQASVLLLLWRQDEALRFVLTRRAQGLRGHSGQVSLPGGRREPGDADAAATALRETREELGIAEGAVRPLGWLGEIYIPPSDFVVRPLVGALDAAPRFRPCAAEVAEVLCVPLAQLFEGERKRVSLRRAQGRDARIPWYALEGHMVWGATAMLLSEFEWRLRAVPREVGSAAPATF